MPPRVAWPAGLVALVALSSLSDHPVRAEELASWTLEVVIDDRKVEGWPLAWDQQVVHLLARDGRLWEFGPGQARDFQRLNTPFSSYTPAQMRDRMLREMGPEFDVTGTGHYLVAHPRGQRDQWGERFEELYRSFVQYFAVRGFTVEAPKFPLVAIVLGGQRQFLEYSAAHGGPVDPSLLGYYSSDTNRIILYDQTEGLADPKAWQDTADTIIHEATHQSAFNTNIHSRFGTTPRWVAEGLGTLFEAPGVWDCRKYPDQKDRINRGRLERFKVYAEGRRRPSALIDLIADDELFRCDPDAAYAEAWAFTFYLVETRPRQYCEYLTLTASGKPFETETPEKRVADFTRVFGSDWSLFEAHYLRFMEGIR